MRFELIFLLLFLFFLPTLQLYLYLCLHVYSVPSYLSAIFSLVSVTYLQSPPIPIEFHILRFTD